jgi:ketosteroid isomerase-like protein
MSAKQEIEAFFAELGDAWDKFDIDRMVAGHSEDVHLISPFGTDHRSRSSIAELMRGMAPVFAGAKNTFHGVELRHINDNLEFFDVTHTVKMPSGQVRRTSRIHGCCDDV